MKQILAQCTKELAQFRHDRLTVALAFVLPLAILLIYGFAIRLETKNIPLSVQDFALSPLSRSYVAQLYATNQFIPAPTIGSSPTAAIDRGVAKATVVIPPDFSRQIKSGRSSNVQVLVDGTDVNNARVIQNSIRATTNFFLRSNNLQPAPQRVDAEVRLWFNPGRKESLYIVPGIYGVILYQHYSRPLLRCPHPRCVCARYRLVRRLVYSAVVIALIGCVLFLVATRVIWRMQFSD